jgi:hypothetical protein
MNLDRLLKIHNILIFSSILCYLILLFSIIIDIKIVMIENSPYPLIVICSYSIYIKQKVRRKSLEFEYCVNNASISNKERHLIVLHFKILYLTYLIFYFYNCYPIN